MSEVEEAIRRKGFAAVLALVLLVGGAVTAGVLVGGAFSYSSYSTARFLFFEGGLSQAQAWIVLVAQGPFAVGNSISAFSVDLQCWYPLRVTRAEIELFGDLVFNPPVQVLNVSAPACNYSVVHYNVSPPSSQPFYGGIANLTADLFFWNGTQQLSWIASQAPGPRLTIQPPQDLQGYQIARWTVALGAFTFVLVALPAGVATIRDLLWKPILEAWRHRREPPD